MPDNASQNEAHGHRRLARVLRWGVALLVVWVLLIFVELLKCREIDVNSGRVRTTWGLNGLTLWRGEAEDTEFTRLVHALGLSSRSVEPAWKLSDCRGWLIGSFGQSRGHGKMAGADWVLSQFSKLAQSPPYRAERARGDAAMLLDLMAAGDVDGMSARFREISESARQEGGNR